MTPASILLIVVGGVVLGLSSDQFVVGAARLSRALRIPMIVVGVVVVGFGTSLPEAVVSGLAAGRDELDVAIGNVVGSNVANLALLLGIAASLRPLSIGSATVVREAPVTVGALAMFAALVQGGFSRLDGVVLLAGLVAVLTLVLREARRGDPLAEDVGELVETDGPPKLFPEAARVVGGLAGTLLGAQLLLVGALDIADALGLDEGFVGLTLVAVGTALPELVTVVQATRRGEPDLVLGNLLGSSTFNALFVGAVIAFAGPGEITDRGLTVVGPITAVGLAAVVWALLRSGMRLERWEGGVLLGVYAAFLVGVA